MKRKPLPFLRELRRRQVLRVALVYGAAAFAVLEASDIALPRLGFSDGAIDVVLILALLGFPLALVLGWIYDITPEGVQRTEQGAGDTAPAAHPWIGRRTALVAGALALVGTGLGAGMALRPSVADAATDVGIAALPFASYSSHPDDHHFTDGIHDEILTQLSRIGALRVISRTSVLSYRDDRKSAAEIARELGVVYIMEGSVRRDGDRVRVAAKLIDTRTDAQVWSDTYDRSMEDMLGLQADVATSIADALRAQLTPGERARIMARQSVDRQAYEVHLRARGVSAEYGVRNRNELAIELNQRAIAIDPNFAAAYANLSHSYAARVMAHGFGPEWADSGVAAARRAVALDPELAEGYAYLGLNLMLLGRLREARPEMERAIRLSPSGAEVMGRLSWLERELGRFDVGLQWARRAVRLDPSSTEAAHNLGATYRELGEHAEAEHWLGRALALQPGNPWAHTYLHYMDLERGRTEEARERARVLFAASGGSAAMLFLAGDVELWAGEWEAAERHYRDLYREAPDARLAGTWWSARLGLATALHGLGRAAEAEPLLERALAESHARLERGEEFPPIHFEIAATHALRGERAQALDWIERTYAAGWRHPELPYYPHLASIRSEPRFRAVMARIERDGAEMLRRVTTLE